MICCIPGNSSHNLVHNVTIPLEIIVLLCTLLIIILRVVLLLVILCVVLLLISVLRIILLLVSVLRIILLLVILCIVLLCFIRCFRFLITGFYLIFCFQIALHLWICQAQTIPIVKTIQIIIRSLFICCIFSCADSIRALSTYIILNICDLSGTYFESADAPPGAPQKRLPH